MSEENIRVINLKKKNKKINPESLIHFLVLASGQLVVQALINSPFHIFASGAVKVQHIRVYLRVVY